MWYPETPTAYSVSNSNETAEPSLPEQIHSVPKQCV